MVQPANRRIVTDSRLDSGVEALVKNTGGVGPLTFAALASMLGAVAAEKIIYVTSRGNDANTGLTLGSSKATIGSAITSLAGAPGLIQLGQGTITETSTWGTVPAGTHIRGLGKAASIVLHGFNGNLANLNDDVKIADLAIDGQGATYTGRCFYFPTGTGRQKMIDVLLKNWDGYCLEFHESGGSQFRAVGLDAYRTSAGTGTGRYAVKISDTQQLGAVPKTFVDFQSQGTCSFDFGGCNGVFITGSVFADLRFTPDTRDVQITTSRWLNQAACTIDGHNNSFVGCDINPALTIAVNADANSIGPGSFNSLPVINNSGNLRNKIAHWTTPGTPGIADTGNLGLTPTIVGDARRGVISIGTGAAPVAGDAITLTIAANVFGATPNIIVTPANFSTGNRQIYAYANSATQLKIGASAGWAASQAVGIYKVYYQIVE